MQCSSGSESRTNSGRSLWGRFAMAGRQQDFCDTWLALQCSLIPNAIQGVLVLGNPDEGRAYEPVAGWPEAGSDPLRLAEISERVLEQRCGLIGELDKAAGVDIPKTSCVGLGYPVLVDEMLHGVVAVEVSAPSDAHLQSAMQQLQWGVAWMEVLFRRRQGTESDAMLNRLKSAVDLLAVVMAEAHFEGAGMAFVTELATRLKCDRVSLGFTRGRHVKVRFISHSAQFGKRMNLNRSIGTAMDEAVVQRKEILYPDPTGTQMLVTRDHEQLAKYHGVASILTIPLYGNDRYYGAITLERAADEPFDENDVQLCRNVSALAGPALEEKRLNDRHLILKILHAGRRQLLRLIGPRYAGRKLALVALAALVAFFSLKTAAYRLSADTIVEGAVRRAMVAPFDGYVNEARLRAGDTVSEGTLICTLDDRDLRLERLNYLSQRTQMQRQYQEAVAQHDRAKANIIEAQRDQVNAQLELVERQLERTRIHAPFDAVITSGDLSQRLGGSVQQGEVLFELAPLDAYRLILQVDEGRIADVTIGQTGTLVLSSFPRQSFEFVVEKITPISSAEEGRNYFRVEAALEEVSDRIRPGMEGVGKIAVDRRKLISIWTRDMMEWLRLWIWSWWP